MDFYKMQAFIFSALLIAFAKTDDTFLVNDIEEKDYPDIPYDNNEVKTSNHPLLRDSDDELVIKIVGFFIVCILYICCETVCKKRREPDNANARNQENAAA